MPELQGRGVVLTGAASGIGEALAHVLAGRGAKLLIADLDASRLVAVTDALRAEGASVEALTCDVADPATAPALAERAIALWGGADIVVNNAGVALVGPVETLPEADARWLMDINFWGVVRGCRAFVPQLRGRPGATLVNISSVFAFVAPPTQSMYAASKAAVSLRVGRACACKSAVASPAATAGAAPRRGVPVRVPAPCRDAPRHFPPTARAPPGGPRLRPRGGPLHRPGPAPAAPTCP